MNKEKTNIKIKPKLWERILGCKAWLANYNMNDNDFQKYFALRWGLRTKYVDKPHYCSFTDKNHKAIRDYENKKKSGKEVFYEYKGDFIKQLKHDCEKEQCSYKESKDRFGNKIITYD